VHNRFLRKISAMLSTAGTALSGRSRGREGFTYHQEASPKFQTLPGSAYDDH
jgi:hypothetical protein